MIPIKSTIALPPGISVGLVRDNTATLPSGRTLAPAGVEGILSKIPLTATQQNLSLELDVTKLGTSEAKYTLPLKWVLYDTANNTYELPNNNITINITVANSVLEENQHNVRGNYDNSPEGTQNAIDDNYDSYTSFKSKVKGYTQWLYFSFTERKVVKRIRIKVTPTHSIRYISVFGAQGSRDNTKYQGVAQWREGSSEYYTIVFKNPVPVDHIVLTQFTSIRDWNGGAWFNIKEVDFYEE